MGTVLFAMGGYGAFLGWYMRMNPTEKMALAPGPAGPALGKTTVRHLDPFLVTREHISKCDTYCFAPARGGAQCWKNVAVNAQQWQ